MLTHKYVGIRKVGKRKCALVEGTASFDKSVVVDSPENNISANVVVNLIYEEDYCFDPVRGILLQTDVYIQLHKEVIDRDSGSVEMESTGAKRVRLELVSVE